MRSNVASIEDIKTFLREVEFKKVLFGGCDREDVLDKLHTVTVMFRELLSEQDERLGAAMAETDRVKAIAANERREFQRLRAQDMEQLRAERAEFAERSERMASEPTDDRQQNADRQRPDDRQQNADRQRIDEIPHRGSDNSEILKRAENEARKIIYQADERSREMLRAREWEIDRMLTEKHNTLESMSAEIERMKEERRVYIRDLRVIMRLLNEDFSQMQIKAQSLIKKTEDFESESPRVVPEIILR